MPTLKQHQLLLAHWLSSAASQLSHPDTYLWDEACTEWSLRCYVQPNS